MALDGCGGGAVNSPTPASTPTATPVATPTPVATATPSPSAFVAGALLTYARTATASGEASLPGVTCLNPESVTETTPATITASVATGQTFAGHAGLASVTSVIDLQGCADGSEATTETDYFATPSPALGAPATIDLVGSTISYPGYAGTTLVTTTYGNAGRIVDEYPSAAGRMWMSLPTATTTATSLSQSYTLSDVRTIAVDGSYTDVADSNAPDGTFYFDTSTTVERSDASGSQTLTGGPDPTASPYVQTRSAPHDGIVIVASSGSPYQPPEPTATPTACPTGATPCPVPPAPTPYPQHAWYPYVPSATAPFETIVSTDKGTSALPTSCAVANAFPTTADLIRTVDSTLDIYVGTTVVTNDAYIDANAGLLCLHLASTQKEYELGPTAADDAPVATNTVVEIVSLRTDAAPASSSRRSRAADARVSPELARLAAFAVARAVRPERKAPLLLRR